MEFGPWEMTLLAIAAVGLVVAAFGLAWIDAAPRGR
jgi:hypothetical protein